MLQYRIIPVTPFQQNCSLVWCDQTNKAALVDPGGDVHLLKRAVADVGVELEKILLTHGHLDHVGGTAQLVQELQLPVEGPHKEDAFWINQLPMQCQMMNFPLVQNFTPDRWLEGRDQVSVGKEVLEVRFCPGHTPGHVVFYHAGRKLAFVGDVLFAGSIGRTDFPRGDYDTLVNAIRQQLWPLGDEVQFVPGHGPMSTFGHERKTNPFVADHRFG
ncbi:MBL fold metallo-hydrolase [Simiduia curdlanivorans]|uniref:MBL fold metallo-hydrolase n=1 Tax=Simiduia curdlanivorans TaxID=1492769 RepID=A0ABV8V6S5_9GAMM|nr:MBL fold metallo-hydrolase [Simiduia curdlanivorans]MDN3638165.1 MBL fold metallo-hydrolase [Simiduia curdlanivorans]